MKLKNTPKSYWESREQYSSGNYHCDDSDVASIRAAQANCTQTDRDDRGKCCYKACTDYDANNQNVDCSCDSDYGECLPSGTGGGHSVAEELKVFEDCKGLSDMNHPECIKLVTDCCNDSMIDCYDLAQPYCVYDGGGGVGADGVGNVDDIVDEEVAALRDAGFTTSSLGGGFSAFTVGSAAPAHYRHHNHHHGGGGGGDESYHQLAAIGAANHLNDFEFGYNNEGG